MKTTININNNKVYELKLKIEKNNNNGFEKKKITSSQDTYNYIKQFYFDDIEIYESFFILLLNRSNQTIAYAKISQGGIAGTVVDIKLIAKYAIESLASNVIIAHNHPSNNVQPSKQDTEITIKIMKGLELIDCRLLDSIILGTDNNYFSYTDEGIL